MAERSIFLRLVRFILMLTSVIKLTACVQHLVEVLHRCASQMLALFAFYRVVRLYRQVGQHAEAVDLVRARVHIVRGQLRHSGQRVNQRVNVVGRFWNGARFDHLPEPARWAVQV